MREVFNMTHPKDDELEAMAADVETVERDLNNGFPMTCERGQKLQEVAAMLRASKGGLETAALTRIENRLIEMGAHKCKLGIDDMGWPDSLMAVINDPPSGPEDYEMVAHLDHEDSRFGPLLWDYAITALKAHAAIESAPDARKEGWRAGIEALTKVTRDCIYHDSAGTGFDEDKFDAGIRALAEKGPTMTDTPRSNALSPVVFMGSGGPDLTALDRWRNMWEKEHDHNEELQAENRALSAKLEAAEARAVEMEGSAQAALAGYEAEREARQKAEAERHALIEARDMMGRRWEKEKACIAELEAERAEYMRKLVESDAALLVCSEKYAMLREAVVEAMDMDCAAAAWTILRDALASLKKGCDA